MNIFGQDIYLDTPIRELVERGIIDRTVGRACESAHPPMETAGDVRRYMREHGDFSAVPGCRRPGRIPRVLEAIAADVLDENMPSRQRDRMELYKTAAFSFLTEAERAKALAFKEIHGHLPMFAIARAYLCRPEASRNEHIIAMCLGMSDEMAADEVTLARVAERFGLTRERVRQIGESYILPDEVMYPGLWRSYANHATYYVDASSPVYRDVARHEVEGMSFRAFAAVMSRVAMLAVVDGRYLARCGWVDEIDAWVKRLERLASMTRTIDNRLSLEGLAMGGTLDPRLKLVVLNQIAPTLGIVAEAPDTIILPKNA